jgi:hypothetical protein
MKMKIIKRYGERDRARERTRERDGGREMERERWRYIEKVR